VSTDGRITLFLCGDIITGRGIDQVLPHACPPRICEPVLTSAVDCLLLAARIVNLETSVT
jgi:hypothetical protein